MPKKVTSLSCTYHPLLISINHTDCFYSVVGPTGVGKSSVGSHGWTFLLTHPLVMHVYSSSTPTWVRKRHKWVTILNCALWPSSLSSKISPWMSTRSPSALSLLTHQALMTLMTQIQKSWGELQCGWHRHEFSISLLPAASCLTWRSYGPEKTCGGLIYLHDVTDVRMQRMTVQTSRGFQMLCGKKNLKAVVFAKSGKLTPEAIARHEKQSSNVYLNNFKKQEAIFFKLLPSHESVDQLVKTVLDRVYAEERVLLIQKELVDLAKMLPTTEVGKILQYTLEEIMEHQNRALAGGSLTPEQIAVHQQKIEMIAPQIKQITVIFSFSQRLLKFFGLVSCFAFSLSMYDHLIITLLQGGWGRCNRSAVSSTWLEPRSE